MSKRATIERWILVHPGFGFWALITVCALISMALAGCSSIPVIETKVVDRPVPVFCEVATPAECKSAYAVDRVSSKDDPLTINRALRAEIEERWACEVKLLAAVKGCNSKSVKIK
jgi:hypothetical protein